MTEKSKNTHKKKRPTVQGFRVVEKACIWMKAGVVRFRECDNDFDCNSCAFDTAMRRSLTQMPAAGSDHSRPGWVTYLQSTYDGASRSCRHVLTGRIESPKICPLNYECHHCAFDQMLDDADLAGAVEKPSFHFAAGYKMADGYYYHMGHGWARFEHGGRVRIGFDDFMTRLFGNLDKLELPPLGSSLVQSEVGLTIHRSRNHAAVLSPLSGTVLATNYNACRHPQIAHADPYGQGWLMIVEPDNPKRNLKKLYFGKESNQWMERESQRLLGMLGPEFEKLAATGGSPVDDIFGSIPELEWNRLVRNFLHTSQKGR